MIGLLHPGQMGAAIGAQLTGAGHEVLWCTAGRGAHTARRAEQAGLRGVGTLAELLDGSEVVLSICPPAAAEEVALGVAEAGFAGVYVDANAISPHRMVQIAERFGSVVDGSIIGPPPGPSTSARVYLSGADAAVRRVHALFAGGGAQPVALSERIGDASALKMAYGSYNKASHALAAVSHALAERYGVGEALRAEASLDGSSALAKTHRLPSVAARAWRWAPEMLEAAESFAAVGLPPELAAGAAAVFDRLAADKDDPDLSVADVLRHLVAQERSAG
jgi:3-hydroxyisobutyrate dehydrogenase-like beta-hydroxyacid dehydrogenase